MPDVVDAHVVKPDPRADGLPRTVDVRHVGVGALAVSRPARPFGADGRAPRLARA